MIDKYRSEVLSFYEEKRASGKLSMNLLHPTCANIRNEFRLLYNLGCDNPDRQMLREFLKVPFEEEMTDFTIKKCDNDRFKALCNYLQKGIKTHERNVEMLAWLIDFRPRPFSNYWRSSNGKDKSLSELLVSQNGIMEENRIEATYLHQHRFAKEEHGLMKNNSNSRKDHNWSESSYEVIERQNTSRFLQKEITLEYPSGIKLSVDASDLALIAQLLKL